jgi:hypothetical protein
MLKHYETKLDAPVIMKGFPLAPRGRQEVPWFGRSQCDKQNKTYKNLTSSLMTKLKVLIYLFLHFPDISINFHAKD